MHARRLLLSLFTFVALLAALAVSPRAAGWEPGDWKPNYAATLSSPEMVEYITNAFSKKGGNCCLWADGFQLGKVYEIYNPALTKSVRLIVFLSWGLKPDDYYHAVVFDYFVTGKYIDLVADPNAFAPGNPTGGPIVWLRRNQGEIEIRCWGGEAQG